MNAFARGVGVSDDDVLGEDISDAALEIAACIARDGAANMTIAFCSGLDECPTKVSRWRAAAMDL